MIFVKKIQTLDYILSPQAKRMAKSKQQARRLLELIVYTVHIYPLWQSLLIIASSSNFYSFSLYYAIPTIPNQTSSNVGHCDSFPVWWMQIEFNHTIYLTEQNLLPIFADIFWIKYSDNYRDWFGFFPHQSPNGSITFYYLLQERVLQKDLLYVLMSRKTRYELALALCAVIH